MRMWLVSAAALLAMQALPAHAERDPLTGAPVSAKQKRPDPSPINDRFYVTGTFYDPATTTILRVDGDSPAPGIPGRTGTVVNTQRDLGLRDRDPQGRIELMFRLRERSKLRMDYYGSRFTGDRALTRQILFGNETFASGDVATSFLDFRSFTLTYTYSFLRTRHFELGAGLAAHFLEADARGAVEAKNLRDEISGAGAFPTLPIDFTWVISHGFAFSTRAQYLKASVHGFTGEVGEYHGDLQYRFERNLSVGLGYTRMKWLLDVNEAHFPGIIRMDVRGPEAFIKVSF